MAYLVGVHRPRMIVWVFVGWTVFVWGTRIRNIWTDATLTTAGQVGRTALVAAFVLPAMAVAVALVRRPAAVWIVRAFAGWTVAFWVVRAVEIALTDHSVAFIVVHALIGLVSIVLAVASWRATMPPSWDSRSPSSKSPPPATA